MSDQYFDKCDHGRYEHDKLRTLLDVATGLHSAKNYDDVGQVLFRNLNKFSSGRLPVGIKLGVYDVDEDRYTIITNTLTYIDQDEISTEPEKLSYPIKDIKYFSKITIDSKKTLLIEDNHSPFSLNIHPEQINASGHSMLFIPLIYEDSVVGLLSFAREPKHSIPPDFVEFFDSIAKYVSIKIGNLLTEKRRFVNEQLTIRSERLYRSLVETSPDAIAMTDTNMKILLCNNNLAELVGAKDKEAIVGKDAFTYFHPEGHSRLREGMRTIFETKKASNREYQLIKENGTIIDCEIDVALMTDTGNMPIGFLALIRDVTQRKRVQAELKLNELRLQGLLELNKNANNSKQSIIDFALQESIKLTSSNLGFVAFVKSDSKDVELVSWSQNVSDNCKMTEGSKFLKVGIDGIWDEAIKSGKPLLINNYLGNSTNRIPEGHVQINNVLAVPIFDGRKIVLIAGIANKEDEYNESDSRQVTIIMSELWRIIENRTYLETISQTKELFQNLVETVNDWIFEIDTHGIITYSSPKVKDILGIDDEEIVGRSLLELLPNDEVEKVRKIYSNYDVNNKQPIYLENTFAGKNGVAIVESSVIPFFNKNEEFSGFRIIARDISMRRYYEKTIDKMERHYQAIVEDQTELIARFTPKGTITFTNEAYCKYFGHKKEDLIGNNLYDFIAEPIREHVKQKLSLLTCDNPFLVSVDREKKPDGSFYTIEWIHHAFIDENNQIIEIQSVGRDISKQKEYEEKLAENNKLIESILQTNPNSLYIYSVNEKKTIFISKNIFMSLGYSDNELFEMGNEITKKVIHPDDIEKLRDSLKRQKNLKDGEIMSSELRVKHKNGGWVWLMTLESVFKRDENGVPIEIIGSSLDITERKVIQDEIVAYKDNLEKIVTERTNRLMVTNKNLEQEIRERKYTEEKLVKSKIILDAIGDGVFTIDKNCFVTSFNRAAESITGFSIDTAIGSRCYDVFKILESDTKLDEIVEKNLKINDKSIHIRNRKGDLIPISLSTYMLYQSGIDSYEIAVTFRDLSQIELLKKELDEKYTFQDIIAKSQKIRQIFTILPDIAQSGSAVLIEGDTGTGKELFAKAIFNLSKRKEMPFITINCAAIPANLLESELFGYMKGSFTDAKQDKKGKVLLADGGTLFLDEIGELPLLMQSKLLRLLENFEFEPIGAIKPVKVDIRVIAATNKSLKDLVETGSFRADLYFRMNTVKILLPPLSERKEDIPYLVEHFIRKFRARSNKQIFGIDNEVMKIFYNYSFPGNIRELEKIIEYAFIVCEKDKISIAHLPEEIIGFDRKPVVENSKMAVLPDNEKIISIVSDYLSKMNITSKKYQAQTLSDEEEKTLIIETINKNRGNKTHAARELNMHYTTLWKKLKKYNIDL